MGTMWAKKCQNQNIYKSERPVWLPYITMCACESERERGSEYCKMHSPSSDGERENQRNFWLFVRPNAAAVALPSPSRMSICIRSAIKCHYHVATRLSLALCFPRSFHVRLSFVVRMHIFVVCCCYYCRLTVPYPQHFGLQFSLVWVTVGEGCVSRSLIYSAIASAKIIINQYRSCLPHIVVITIKNRKLTLNCHIVAYNVHKLNSLMCICSVRLFYFK